MASTTKPTQKNNAWWTGEADSGRSAPFHPAYFFVFFFFSSKKGKDSPIFLFDPRFVGAASAAPGMNFAGRELGTIHDGHARS